MTKLKDKILIAGPCSAESREQVLGTAKYLAGRCNFFRAGVWKPRTQPGQFEGRGEEAFEWILAAKKEFGINPLIEVATVEQVELAKKYDLKNIWIGARTSINPFLVEELSRAMEGCFENLFIKNPLAPDLKLWIGSLERVLRYNQSAKVHAIHRGFSTYAESKFRNSPLWDIALSLKKFMPEIPLICDPSHMAGKRAYLPRLSQMAMDLNYDGLMLEVHPDPSLALSDSEQQLNFSDFENLISQVELKKDVDTLDEENLTKLRGEIDQIDENLLKLLKNRKEIVSKIAHLKREHFVSTYSNDRFNENLSKWKSEAKHFDLSTDETELLYRLLHSFSLTWQSSDDLL